MIDRNWARTFAEKWIASFNSHDLERILILYDDAFEMTSPYIIERMGIPSGKLKGKQAVRPYWQQSLNLEPPLKFILLDVFTGVDTVIIYYQNIGRKQVCETFEFNDKGKIVRAKSQHGRIL